MKLYKHQQEALDLIDQYENCAIYYDMGLGKTFIGSEKMWSLAKTINLVVCQKSKVNDWVDHFRQYYSDFYEVFDMSTKKGYEAFFRHNADKVGIINYDLVWRRKELLKLTDFCLMLDESSLIQNNTSKRTKAILKMKPSNVILLSGTPTSGRYERLWTQMKLLGWNIKKSDYDARYMTWAYIDYSGSGFRVPVVTGYRNVPELKRKMRDYGCIFKKTEECMELPDQIEIITKVKSSAYYKRFMRDRYIEIGGKELEGDTSLTMRLYARQLCGQYSAEKLAAVKDMLDSTEGRVIVFYNFTAEAELLKKLSNRPLSVVNGQKKDLKAYEEEDDSITLIQYQAGAYGLNLQKADRIIYFTLPESSEMFEQSKKRIHRIGQTKKCMYYIPLVEGTVEEKILETLRLRKDYTDALFKEHIKGG